MSADNPSGSIRPPAVAGMFYPDDPERLNEALIRLFSDSQLSDPPAKLVLAPHAGYPYSGRLAARSFAALGRAPIRRVVIVGPSHVEAFDHAAVFSGDGYATPLGTVPVDKDAAERIGAHGDSVRVSPRGHLQPHLARGEHGIEVELPFLQRTHPDATIVPIVMGDQSWRACADLGDALRPLAEDPETVFVASTDLSHFYDYHRATALDERFCDVLTAGDAAALHEAIERGECEACGAGPVVACMLATQHLPGRRFTVLERANSGDVTGDRGSVVGYVSAMMTASASKMTC